MAVRLEGLMSGVAEMAKEREKGPAKPAQQKGEPASVKLYRVHARKLSELAREEDLEGGSAEAFEKHFGALLDNLLIAAKDARLKALRNEAKS